MKKHIPLSEIVGPVKRDLDINTVERPPSITQAIEFGYPQKASRILRDTENSARFIDPFKILQQDNEVILKLQCNWPLLPNVLPLNQQHLLLLSQPNHSNNLSNNCISLFCFISGR